MEAYAIVNPISGRKPSEPALRAVGRLLEAQGVQLHRQTTERPGHATQLAADLPQTARAVIVVGGDGTVREVVEGLIGRRIPFLVFPTGTENIVAKHFAMTRKPANVVHCILHGVAKPLDLAVANGRHFLIVSGVGFDADVVHRLTSMRTGHISHLHYGWPMWRTFATHRFPDLEVELDSRSLFRGRGLVLIGNLPRYSIGMRILDRARSDDGLLDVCVYPCASRARLVGHSLRTLLRRHIGAKGTLYARGRTITVRAASGAGRVRYQVDGDVGGLLPVRYEVLAGVVSCLMPTGQ